MGPEAQLFGSFGVQFHSSYVQVIKSVTPYLQECYPKWDSIPNGLPISKHHHLLIQQKVVEQYNNGPVEIVAVIFYTFPTKHCDLPKLSY